MKQCIPSHKPSLSLIAMHLLCFTKIITPVKIHYIKKIFRRNNLRKYVWVVKIYVIQILEKSCSCVYC